MFKQSECHKNLFQFVTHSYCVLLAMKLANLETSQSIPEEYPVNGTDEERSLFRRKLSSAVVENVFPALSGVETILKSRDLHKKLKLCCDEEEGTILL